MCSHQLFTFKPLLRFEKSKRGPTWNLRMSRGFPAFFRQFWLHLRKNFRKNLWRNKWAWLGFQSEQGSLSQKSLPSYTFSFLPESPAIFRVAVALESILRSRPEVIRPHPRWTFFLKGTLLVLTTDLTKKINLEGGFLFREQVIMEIQRKSQIDLIESSCGPQTSAII